MKAIELSNVSKRFGAKWAVHHVSFAIEEGQCYGLIGPNGAGKTTTFSMMCGYLHPTEGRLQVLGADPSTPGALKRKVGVLPQDALLPGAWSVGPLLTYWAKLSGLTDPQGEARSALEKVGLAETWDTRAATLSHGMAKRVCMAQALMGSPPIVLFDEPTAGLDPKIAASVRQLIHQMKGRHTVVVSSHNLQELEELCDATALLDRGQLVTAASMAEMTAQAAEFRVQIARGDVPLAEVRALFGCTGAQLLPSGVLTVHFDGGQVAAEELITRTAGLLIAKGVLFSSITRGKKLEEKVLQLS
ncbi:MAG: ABC transporter ATP-binding protein [Myxococcota bacterium]